MKKSNAIKILERQKKILVEKSYTDLSVWRQSTSSYLLDFFGQDSSEYHSFYNFSFRVVADNMEQLEIMSDKKHKEMVGLIDNCIDKIKHNGLLKHKNKNVLSDKDNWALITIATGIFITGISVGIWIHKLIYAIFPFFPVFPF